MTTGADVVAEARTWLDTPYHHQGRVRGVGVDCLGLLVGVGRALGLTQFDITNYPRIPTYDSLTRGCEDNLVRVRPPSLQAGDVLLLRFDKWPGHLAILTDDDTIIHAYFARRKVVEHRIDADWWRKTRGTYRFPGVSRER